MQSSKQIDCLILADMKILKSQVNSFNQLVVLTKHNSNVDPYDVEVNGCLIYSGDDLDVALYHFNYNVNY